MARATGIHISGSAVRVADVEGSDRKLRIRGYGEAVVPAVPDDERVGALTKAIKEAFKAAKASRDQVVLGIPVRDCVIREITVPFTQVDQIAKVIKFEAEPHLHSCSIEEVVIAFHKVGEVGNRSTILVVAARKDKIRQILAAMEKCGIDPLSIDIDAAGLYGISQNLAATEDKGNYAVVEVGNTASTIALVRNKNLRVIRSMRLGQDSISSRISKDLDIDASEARTRAHAILQKDRELTEDLMIRPVDLPDAPGSETVKTSDELQRDMVRQRQSDLVGRLEQEIMRTVDMIKLAEPLDCVYVTGPGALLPRFVTELGDRLRIPVHQLDVLSETDSKFTEAAADLVRGTGAVAVGLAAKLLGVDPLRFDFRQEEFVFAKRFDRLKVPLLCTVFLLFAVNVCWFFFENAVRESTSRQLGNYATIASNLFTQHFVQQRPDDRETSNLDEKRVAQKSAEIKDLNGLDKIYFIGRTCKEFHEDLRKRYDLDGVSKSAASPRSGGGSDGKTDVRFVSALRRWNQAWKALTDAQIRDMSVNMIRCTSSQVELALTLPSVWEDKERGQLDVLRQLGIFEENMKKLPAEEGFKSLTWNDYSESKVKPGWIDVPRLVIEFAKEDQ